MKKFATLLLIVMLLFVTSLNPFIIHTLASDIDTPVSDLDIADFQASMTVGTSQLIIATVIPADATNQAITYTSLTPDIATVNALGRVRALSPGTALIQVSSGDISYTLNIIVEAPVQITAIDINYQDTMTVGETQSLYPSVLPADAVAEFYYLSSDPSVASVNVFGKVTALSPGYTIITVSAGGVKTLAKITVKDVQGVKEIDFNDVQTEMTIGTSQIVSVNVYPSDAVNQTVQYTSSNNRILTVNAFGRVNAIGRGTAQIIAKVGTIEKSVLITVKEKIVPTDIDVDEDISSINIGAAITLNATVLPINAEDQNIQYTSSDPSILTVNETGKVRGISIGTAVITLQAGSITKSISIKVVEKAIVTSIEVTDFKDELKIDDTQTLSTTLSPSDAEDQKIRYSSSNPKVATVSESGVITAVGKGSTVITLSSGAAKKTLRLSVYVATEQMQVSDNYLIMRPKDTHRVSVSVAPKDADQNITFRSTNEAVATVGPTGQVTAISTGKTSIVVANKDSMKAITVIVNDGAWMSNPDDNNLQQENFENADYSQMLSELILTAEDEQSITVIGEEYSFVTADVLKALYQSKKVLNIRHSDYIIKIHGRDIKNAENTFSSNLEMTTSDAGLSFIVNQKNQLPGTIEIEFLNLNPDYRYLYLLNDTMQKYENLNAIDGNAVTLSVPGEYLLTDSRISTVSIPIYILEILSIFVILGAIVFIIVKKKYWFW